MNKIELLAVGLHPLMGKKLTEKSLILKCNKVRLNDKRNNVKGGKKKIQLTIF